MSLDELSADIEATYAELGEAMDLSLDRETRNELALLAAAYDPDELDELVRRGVHMLFQSAVETGNIDFHLRSGYDVTYDEYLSGMTYEEMTGGAAGAGGPPDRDDTRRYQQ
ncbi:hypothetical protein [Haloglomus halophilum]|uniref:hypothetical protein n=1 Tax=Haloglomus halophilum TaxID=2962672 RepID=UPI0020CA23C9|nr:hypothetical protein [Haloglomus halophilum]